MKFSLAKLFVCSVSLLFLTAFTDAEVIEKQQMRRWFMASIDSKDTANTFHDKMEGYDGENPLKLGYKGASKAFMARYNWSPFKKMHYLEEGMNLVNGAIEKVPNDIELRFIRLSITYYLPGFLGYGSHIKEDKKAIMTRLKSEKKFPKPDKVQKVIIEFMLDSDLCSKQEKKRLKEMT